MYKSSLPVFFLLFCFSGFSQSLFHSIENGKTKTDKFKNEKAINAFHKSHMGKMLFTYERIPFKADNASPSEIFDYGKTLFLREYWTQTMADAYKASFGKKPGAEIAILYEVELEAVGIYEYVFYGWSGSVESETWFTNWLIVSGSGDGFEPVFHTNLIENALSKFKSKLSSKQKLKVTSYIYDTAQSRKGVMMASGEIFVNIPHKGALPEYSQAIYPPCMNAPKMKDSALEKTFVDIMNQQGWKERFAQAVIYHDDFKIIRNSLTSIIESRTLGAELASKKPDGTCMYQRFTFSQEHDGKGFNGKWKLYSNGDQVSIPCSCLNNPKS
jgi:hypothetical protein